MGYPGRMEGQAPVRSSHRKLEGIHMRAMSGRVRHPDPADRRYPGPDPRQSDRPVTGVYLPDGRIRPRTSYHPDRISQPAAEGEKGEPGWQPISGTRPETNFETIQGLAKEKQTGSFGFLMGDRNTLLAQFAGLFTARLFFQLFPWRTPGINELGSGRACGEFPPFSFDLTRTDYLITFGTNS
jgi:hypothetical protein